MSISIYFFAIYCISYISYNCVFINPWIHRRQLFQKGKPYISHIKPFKSHVSSHSQTKSFFNKEHNITKMLHYCNRWSPRRCTTILLSSVSVMYMISSFISSLPPSKRLATQYNLPSRYNLELGTKHYKLKS